MLMRVDFIKFQCLLARLFTWLKQPKAARAKGKWGREVEGEKEGGRGKEERRQLGEGNIDCVKWAAKCWLRFWSWTSNALHCLTSPPPKLFLAHLLPLFWAVPDHDKAQRKRKCPQRWAVEPTALDLLSALSMGRDPSSSSTSSSSSCIHALTIVFTRYSLSIHSVIKTPVARETFLCCMWHAYHALPHAAACCPHPGLALNNAWHDAAWIRLEICHTFIGQNLCYIKRTKKRN